MTQLEQALELNRTRQVNVNISVQLASYQMRDLQVEEKSLVEGIKKERADAEAAAAQPTANVLEFKAANDAAPAPADPSVA